MAQRIITGSLLAAALALLMYIGGTAISIAAMICICLGVYEEFHVLRYAGHHPVSLPTWIGMALSIPMVLVFGSKVILPVMVVTCLATVACILFSREPRLDDLMLSILPLISIVLPGMCIIGLASIPNQALMLTYLCLLFVVPVCCDTMALIVGSKIGGPKFCPAVSPKKTISGALGGMIGALLGVLLVGTIAFIGCNPETRLLLPAWWEYLLIGLVGGAASQLGDLMASLVKRHCGVKDFSNLFPGHGGMMDRMDSVLFMALIVYGFYLLH